MRTLGRPLSGSLGLQGGAGVSVMVAVMIPEGGGSDAAGGVPPSLAAVTTQICLQLCPSK